MASVYVVEGGEYEDRHIISIHSTPELAEKSAQEYSEKYGHWRLKGTKRVLVADGAKVVEYELNG